MFFILMPIFFFNSKLNIKYTVKYINNDNYQQKELSDLTIGVVGKKNLAKRVKYVKKIVNKRIILNFKIIL
jgi:hypothetical protein